MPGRMKQGQSVFIPFKNGESIYDSQNKARMYMSREKFEASFPAWRFGDVDLVEYVPKPQLISVKDRLPEDGEVVLVLANGNPHENITLIDAYELAEYSRGEHGGWILEMWPMWEDAKVTHWMPLPEKPDEYK